MLLKLKTEQSVECFERLMYLARLYTNETGYQNNIIAAYRKSISKAKCYAISHKYASAVVFGTGKLGQMRISYVDIYSRQMQIITN